MDYDLPDWGEYNEDNIVNRNQKSEKRSKRPRYIPSNKPQSFIKNAVTGVPYPYVVGSKEQALLYKIVDATGTCDAENSFGAKLRQEFTVKIKKENNLLEIIDVKIY